MPQIHRIRLDVGGRSAHSPQVAPRRANAGALVSTTWFGDASVPAGCRFRAIKVLLLSERLGTMNAIAGREFQFRW